jgi:hypothetical protein
MLKIKDVLINLYIQFLHFVHSKLLKFYKREKENIIKIHTAGKFKQLSVCCSGIEHDETR